MPNKMATMQGCCECPTVNPPTDCTPEENFAACADALSCFQCTPFLIEWEFQDNDGVNWSALNAIKCLMIPHGDCPTGGAHSSNVPESVWDRLFDNLNGGGGTIFHIGSDCDFGPCSNSVVFGAECTEDGLRIYAGYAARLTDCLGMSNPTYWLGEIIIDDPFSFPLAPLTLAPVDTGIGGHGGDPYTAACTFEPNTFLYKVPKLLSVTVTQLGACPTQGDGCPNPPQAGFSLVDKGSCRFGVVDESASGGCEHECYWSDGHVGCDRTGVDYSASGECGENEYALTQHVVDTRGCIGEHTEEGECCSCEDGEGDPCAEPAGSLDATLLTTAGTSPCTYRLTANCTDEGYDGVCNDFLMVEWMKSTEGCDPDLECTCEEIAAGDCGGASCSGFLNCGESTEITIDSSARILYRVREQECGCWGPWQELLLPCSNCNCCEDMVVGAYVTVSGLDNDSDAPCNCPVANQTYYVPANLFGGCGGYINFTELISCLFGETSEALNFEVQWSLVCNEGSPDTYLLAGRIGVAFGGADEFELSGSLEIPFECGSIGGGMTLSLNGMSGVCAGGSLSIELVTV